MLAGKECTKNSFLAKINGTKIPDTYLQIGQIRGLSSENRLLQSDETKRKALSNDHDDMCSRIAGMASRNRRGTTGHEP